MGSRSRRIYGKRRTRINAREARQSFASTLHPNELSPGDRVTNLRLHADGLVCPSPRDIDKIDQPRPYMIRVRIIGTIGPTGLHTWPLEECIIVEKGDW